MAEQRFRWISLLLCLLFFPLAACEKEKPQPLSEPVVNMEMEKAHGIVASAELKPTEGNQGSGIVTFTDVDGTVRIVADLEGLKPGKHGFHIHEKGDCSAPDASSAGGHFNPSGTPHGAPENPPDQRHVGDLGNLEAAADGKAHYEWVGEVISLEGPNSIVGKAVIVHAEPDDLTSQPTGNAGARVACGVIQVKE